MFIQGLFVLAVWSLVFVQVNSQVVDKFQLKCTEDAIQVDLTTRSAFNGVIYTQGSFNRIPCSVKAKMEKSFQIKFSLDECLTVKVNDTDYSNILIVQHNPNFVSKGDLAFNLMCAFGTERQHSVNVTEPLTFDTSELNESIGERASEIGTLLLSNERLISDPSPANTQVSKKSIKTLVEV